MHTKGKDTYSRLTLHEEEESEVKKVVRGHSAIAAYKQLISLNYWHLWSRWGWGGRENGDSELKSKHTGRISGIRRDDEKQRAIERRFRKVPYRSLWNLAERLELPLSHYNNNKVHIPHRRNLNIIKINRDKNRSFAFGIFEKPETKILLRTYNRLIFSQDFDRWWNLCLTNILII